MKNELEEILASFGKIEKAIEESKAREGTTDKEVADMREMLDGVTTRIRKMEEAGETRYRITEPTQNVTKREKLCRWMGDMFLEQVRGIKPQWQSFYEEELRALDQSVGTADKGGVLVPVPLIPEILGITEIYGLARQLCRRMPMGQQVITIPIAKDSKPSVYWESEGTTAQQTGVTFGSLTLTAKKMLVSSQLSSEIQQESIIAIMSYLIDCLGRASAEEEDRLLLLGNTLGSPADPFDGVFGNCAASSWPIGTSLRTGQDQKVECSSGIDTEAEFVLNASGLSYDKIIDTIYRVHPQVSGNGTFVFHPRVEAMLRKIKDGDNLPIWGIGLGGAVPATIASRPYRTSLAAPVELQSAGGRILCYGDFSNYAFGTREQLEIAFNDSVGFLNDTRWVRMKQRMSLTCLDNQAFASLVFA